MPASARPALRCNAAEEHSELFRRPLRELSVEPQQLLLTGAQTDAQAATATTGQLVRAAVSMMPSRTTDALAPDGA